MSLQQFNFKFALSNGETLTASTGAVEFPDPAIAFSNLNAGQGSYSARDLVLDGSFGSNDGAVFTGPNTLEGMATLFNKLLTTSVMSVDQDGRIKVTPPSPITQNMAELFPTVRGDYAAHLYVHLQTSFSWYLPHTESTNIFYRLPYGRSTVTDIDLGYFTPDGFDDIVQSNILTLNSLQQNYLSLFPRDLPVDDWIKLQPLSWPTLWTQSNGVTNDPGQAKLLTHSVVTYYATQN